ncbi:MAG: hypothetical protein BWY95_01663 [Bacteroidetes bacterium ADurb.BinA104]|nr:MAG: hypothetical protein BWY95_01663 [Bacteroidetes bacterium ADurb.BinA104]
MFLLQSLLVIEMVAVFNPIVDGSKVTVKVVLLPAATGETGCTVTLKSAALTPVMPILGLPVNIKSAYPLFSIVKVRTTVPVAISMPPKSVWSVSEGVTSPLAMETPLART